MTAWMIAHMKIRDEFLKHLHENGDSVYGTAFDRIGDMLNKLGGGKVDIGKKITTTTPRNIINRDDMLHGDQLRVIDPIQF